MIIVHAVENDGERGWIILRGKLEGVGRFQITSCIRRIIAADEDNVLARDGIDIGWRYINQWACDVKGLPIERN